MRLNFAEKDERNFYRRKYIFSSIFYFAGEGKGDLLHGTHNAWLSMLLKTDTLTDYKVRHI